MWDTRKNSTMIVAMRVTEIIHIVRVGPSVGKRPMIAPVIGAFLDSLSSSLEAFLPLSVVELEPPVVLVEVPSARNVS